MNYLTYKLAKIRRENRGNIEDIENNIVYFKDSTPPINIEDVELSAEESDKVELLVAVTNASATVNSKASGFTKTELEDMDIRHREAIYISGKKSPAKASSIRLRTEAELLGRDLQEYAREVQTQIEEYQVARAALVVAEKLALVANK